MEYFAVFRYEFYPHGKNRELQVFDKREVWKFNSADDKKEIEKALNQKQVVLESKPKIGKVLLEMLIKGEEIPLS